MSRRQNQHGRLRWRLVAALAVFALSWGAVGVALADTGDYDSAGPILDGGGPGDARFDLRQLIPGHPGFRQNPDTQPDETDQPGETEDGGALVPGPAYGPLPKSPPEGGTTPRQRALYKNGPSGRYLLGGRWYFRRDQQDQGFAQRWQRERQRHPDWKPIGVPYAWNAGAYNDTSLRGTVGWYRKEFRVPDRKAALSWMLRFESVNYRTEVFLNGRSLGKNTGAHLAFELPAKGIKRKGLNILVVRVANTRLFTDLPPHRVRNNGGPSAGWWNWGGILREVYLRKVERVGFGSVLVNSNVPCRRCPARVTVRTTLTNLSSRTQNVELSGKLGKRRLPAKRGRVRPRRETVIKQVVRIRKPKLWSPKRPRLVKARLNLRVGRGGASRGAGSYSVTTGLRSLRVDGNGILRLNGVPLKLRGFGYHEDRPGLGAAISNADRRRSIRDFEQSGARVIRGHYPLHPYTHELADRKGIFIWSEIPLWGMKTRYLRLQAAMQEAFQQLQQNVLQNGSHPSILVWSLANELTAQGKPALVRYINGGVQTIHRFDRSTPIGIATLGYPLTPGTAAYNPLDVIGVNEYFGWYKGPQNSVASRSGLAPYIDRLRTDYPDKALMISEFGAEANRRGPRTEKGTYDFQRDFADYHLDVFDARPYLAGAIWWTIQEFKVRPSWDGGNPKPGPDRSLHQKGVISYDYSRYKPAYDELKAHFQATDQSP